MRFTEGPPPIACVGVGEMVPQWPFVANGPTDYAKVKELLKLE